MRTKIFTILMALMLIPTMARALTYTEANADISSFDPQNWSDAATCNAQLKVDDIVINNATDAARYTVLAYINGQLRGYCDDPQSPVTGVVPTYIYMTTIRANAATETGAEITFYVLDKDAQKVYQSAHTHTWSEGTLELPSQGMIEVSTNVLVTEISTTDSTVFASAVDKSLFPSSNYASMYSWCVDLTPYYTVLPEDATDKTVTVIWDYSNDNYATERASNGKWYMFVSEGGTYTVTIIANDACKATSDLTLTVKIPVTGIIPHNPTTVLRQDIITSGYDISNKFRIQPDEATDKSVTYELISAKTTCAGTLTGSVFKPAANGKGDVYVKITSVSNPTVSDEYKFTVAVKVEDLVLTTASKTMNVGESVTLASLYSLTPSDADGTVTITSSNATVANVDNTTGKLNALAPGEVTLTLTVPTGEMEILARPLPSPRP